MALPSRRAERAAARAKIARRHMLISSASTAVVVGLLLGVVLTSEGWPVVRETFFSWEYFKKAFPDVLSGFWLDIRMFMVVEVIVLVLGLAIALCRVSRMPALFPLRAAAVIWVDVFRGIPTILLIYLVGFGLPALKLTGIPTSAVVLGCGALAVSYSAYVAEVYRSGIESIEPNQRAAALAVGLTESQALRHVIVPQAVRRVVPPLLNDFISLQKDVALISILGPLEAFRQAQIWSLSTFNYTPLLAAALLYLVVTIPSARFVDRVQKKQRERSRGAGR